MSSNRRHAELVIHEGASDSYRSCGLEAVSESAVDEVAERCKRAGIEVLSRTPSLAAIDKSVTFQTSEGLVFEVHTPMPEDRASKYHGPGVRPKTLDHINFTAVDPEQWSKEMADSCGFLLSERTTGFEISWMRAADRRHHTVAAVKSHAGGVHHLSWEFNSFQDMKTISDSLIPEERRLIWGPGRHGAGDNLFLYFRDSADFLVECIAEMELMQDDAPVRISDPGEGLSNWKVVNQWGALPPIEWVESFTPISAAAGNPGDPTHAAAAVTL
ncbi:MULTISPECIES: glyoxalase [unclassified Diaminobutyricimonas]|uniref:glyoxalase n=1 Tax=unclassified Diaminobutyricimonas TaxID=2643261 RepID=UPI0012F4D7C2|nr:MULTISPECIES: glyoxalase [unclassified Diaminobutyricimonas]